MFNYTIENLFYFFSNVGQTFGIKEIPFIGLFIGKAFCWYNWRVTFDLYILLNTQLMYLNPSTV